MVGYSLTGQRPQWAVVPMKKEEETSRNIKKNKIIFKNYL